MYDFAGRDRKLTRITEAATDVLNAQKRLNHSDGVLQDARAMFALSEDTLKDATKAYRAACAALIGLEGED